MDRFTLSANTLSRTVKENRAARIEVEIGDSKQLDFKPQFKIKRWDNEVNFSMRAEEEAGATMVEEDGKVKYKGKDIEVHQYEKPDAGEDGGFEFEWLLNKKPENNILRTTIQHKGLDFFYQPEITDEEAQASSIKGDKRTLEEIKREMRPENVVGSYAAYHSTKRNNIVGEMEYKTGKAFHIYRPHAIDNAGVKAWCELDITDGELTVTVPEDFLNKASYPVVVDPTFGYTSVGGTTLNTWDTIHGAVFTSNETNTVNSVSVYMDGNGSSGDFKSVIYETDNTLVATSQEGTYLTTGAWRDVTFTSPPSVTNGAEYALLAWADANGRGGRGDSGSKSNGRWFRNGSTYGSSSPSPWNGSKASNFTNFSIYATYTASGGGFNPAFAHRRLLL